MGTLLGAVVLLVVFSVANVLAQDIEELSNPYQVSFKGLGGTDLEDLFKQISDTYIYRAKPPPTLALLKVRVREDVLDFNKVMKSRGYFNAETELKFEGAETNRDLKVVFVFTLNKPFTFGRVVVSLTNELGHSTPTAPDSDALNLAPGAPAEFKEIIRAESSLTQIIKQQGYPFAKIISKTVVADYARSKVDVSFMVTVGPRAHFGQLEISGLDQVKKTFVTERVPWEQGDLFQPSQLQTFRERLDRSGLFAVVVLSNQQEVEPDGEIDVKLQLVESPRHSIGFGVGYNTEKGAGIAMNWENRNLRGNGEKLHFEANITEQNTQGEISYRIPEFFSPKLALKIYTRLGQDRPRAFTSLFWKNSIGLDWRITDRIILGGAYVFKADRVEQFGNTENYLLQSTPLNIKWDFRNDPIEPVRGGVFFFEVEPFLETLEQYQFVRERLQYAQVLRLLKKPQLTFTANTRMGSIQGAGMFDVPGDERFYAGGSDTVRGYAYQTVGPFLDDDPTGGLSLFTLNFELALKVYGPIALVYFLDGGTVFEEPTPDWHGDLLWGTGGGLRVYSPVGAIGLELGIPLNRRSVDDAYQLYITIGFQF